MNHRAYVWTAVGALASAAGVALAGDSLREVAVVGHVDQADIVRGAWSVRQLQIAGERLFRAQFTIYDGVGRPGATGNPSPTRRPLGSAPMFLRTAGLDANSCFGCHNAPEVGGAGEIVANVFAGLASREPVLLSVDPGLSAERGTPGMNGSGAIELLAREMTLQLHGIRDAAIAEAKKSGREERRPLLAKGVSFGFVTGLADGNFKMNEIDGIDRDLVVRTWSQKGIVTSLRTFTVTAMNQHHGMEADERFGVRTTGVADFDRDGISEELTEGDITALVVFQAGLPVPGRVLPASAERRQAVEEGEVIFRQIGCGGCHVPEMVLEDPVFSEPGPFNLEGTLRRSEVEKTLQFDLTRDTTAPRLARDDQGQVVVRAFTDFKRHRICDRQRPFFCNETLVQGFAPIDEFITKRLWDVGNTGPYGHRGDITTLGEAILHHGGEARAVRMRFEQLSTAEQGKVLLFLRSMQALPAGSAPVVTEPEEEILPYAQVPSALIAGSSSAVSSRGGGS